MSQFQTWLLPPGTAPDAALILAARGIRAFTDGYVALLLPYYLTLLGYSAFQVGAIATATLLGSGLLTLLAGMFAYRFRLHVLLTTACLLMLGTGLGFAVTTDFLPLLLIAVIGTLNPSSGDVSVFSPLEQTLLSHAAASEQRTALFSRYSLVGHLVGALGALAAAIPGVLAQAGVLEIKSAVQLMFVVYGLSALAALALYRRLASAAARGDETRAAPLGASKGIVYRLAALFSLDAFAGGFAVQSLLALWLFQRFDLSVEAAGSIFFWMGLLAAASFLAAPPSPGASGSSTPWFSRTCQPTFSASWFPSCPRCRWPSCCSPARARCRPWTCRRAVPTSWRWSPRRAPRGSQRDRRPAQPRLGGEPDDRRLPADRLERSAGRW